MAKTGRNRAPEEVVEALKERSEQPGAFSSLTEEDFNVLDLRVVPILCEVSQWC